MKYEKKPKSNLLLRALFWARGSVWVVLSYLYAVSYLGEGRDSSVGTVVIAALLLATATIYFILGWYMRKLTQTVWMVSVVFLASQIILTITDNMGMIDFFSLTVDGLLLILLLLWWGRFLKKYRG